MTNNTIHIIFNDNRKNTRNTGTRKTQYNLTEECDLRKILSFGKCQKQYLESMLITSRMSRNDDLRANPMHRPTLRQN